MSAICEAHKKKVAPDWAVAVAEKMLKWGTCPREAGPPGPRLSSPGERERNAVMAIRVRVTMLQFCSVSNSLSHTTLSIKWEVYFSKELCRSSLLCRRYDSVCRCVCIVGHGYTTICSVLFESNHPSSFTKVCEIDAFIAPVTILLNANNFKTDLFDPQMKI